MAAFLVILLSKFANIRGHAARPSIPIVLVLALTVLNLALYPATRHLAHPSTGPDAMIVPFHRLLRGTDPYTAPLWDGALISPGPGWWLLNAPLTGFGVVALLCPLWLGLATALMARRNVFAAVIFLVTLFTCQDFIAQSVAGHDIFVVNLAICVVCLLAEQVAIGTAPLVPVAILAGLVATARVPLIILIPTIGLGLARRNSQTGKRFIWLASAVAISLHLVFAAWAAWDGTFYQPLHVFARARGGAGAESIIISAIATCAAARWVIIHARHTAAQLMFSCWLIEFCLFAPIGFGELVNVNHFTLSAWEGRNYVAWSLPLLCGYLGLYFALGPLNLAQARESGSAPN